MEILILYGKSSIRLPRPCDHLDVLVNNAGISHIGLLMDMTDEDWDKVLPVTSLRLLLLPRCHSSYAVTRKRRIINISSMWGVNGASCEAAYSASKAGVGGLTQALAKELARSKIPVNALACGVIDTRNEINNLDEEETGLNLRKISPGPGRFSPPP